MTRISKNAQERRDLAHKIATETYLPRLKFDWSASQPIGGHGFRKGTWNVLLDGQPHKVFASVPHASELDEQSRQVLMSAALELAWADPALASEEERK